MVVITHVVIVEVDQALNGFFDGRHLNQGHFMILEKLESFHSAAGVGEQDSEVFFSNVLRDV